MMNTKHYLKTREYLNQVKETVQKVEMLKKRDQAMGSAIAVAAMLIVGVVSAAFVLANRRYLGGRK